MFGTEAGFWVDMFMVVLLLLLPAMATAVALVRKGKVKAHARIMATCFVLFIVAVAAFEMEVQFGAPGPPLARTPLWIHLCFAIPCLLLWARQIMTAKSALTSPAPHRRRGKILMGLLVATVGTGVWLYLATF